VDYRFTDLVDIQAFRTVLESFYQATGILHGLVDDENRIISSIGWQEVCTHFHRVNPCTNARCLASNLHLAEHLHDGEYVGSPCKNGLMDYATPIIIEGRQLATLYFGQIFHEPPDMDFFRRQAQECGFDEEAYLAAIAKVPILSKERIDGIMSFYAQLAQMLARNGLSRVRERETERRLAKLNQELAFHVDKRTAELTEKNKQLKAEIEERCRTEEALRDSKAQLQAILDSSPVGIGWSDIDGTIQYINNKFTELFGYTLDDIPTVEAWYARAFPDRTFREHVVGEWGRKTLVAKHAGTKPPTLEVPIVCKHGGVRHVIINVSWVGNRRLVNFSDISERWLVEQRAHNRDAVLEMIARGEALQSILNAIARSIEQENERMICAILLSDRDGRRLRIGVAPSLPGFYNEAIDGLEIGEGVGSCGTAAATKRRVIVEDVQSHPYWAGFEDLVARAGIASCWSEPILSSKGGLLGTFAIHHHIPSVPDVSDLELISYAANLASIAIEHCLANEQLERQAYTDFLTELANRRHFLEQAESELKRSLRYNTHFSLLMVDVDYFKSINDQYGHKTGDMVLKALAGILKDSLRQVDIVGRLGGEEFAAILPETGAAEAWEAAERMRSAVANALMRSDTEMPFHVTISVGVATLSAKSNDIETLLRQADIALYAAKNHGRNQVRLSTETQFSGSTEALADFVKLSWNLAYESGDALIDAQHRELFCSSNDLLAAILSEFPKDEIVKMIDALILQVIRHFENEEVILNKVGFPRKDEHATIHAQLIEQANGMVKRFQDESLVVGELFQFLARELIAKHMLQEDRKFFAFFKPENRSVEAETDRFDNA